MRKFSFVILFFLFALSLSQQASSQIVTRHTALQAAEYFITNNSTTGIKSIASADSICIGSSAHLFSVSLHNGGYILISGEKRMVPVLGYVLQGDFSIKNASPAFKQLLSEYAEQFTYAQEQIKPDKYRSVPDWFKTQNSSRELNSEVTPLIQTQWHQTYPYNQFCPSDPNGPGGHAFAGCAASALAMILNYYRYPNHGVQAHSYHTNNYGILTVNFAQSEYQWNAQLNDITNATDPSNIDAVAKLIYDCGVSVSTEYGGSNSSATIVNIPYAARNFFSFSENARLKNRNDYSTDTEWLSLMKGDLNSGYPIIYRGESKNSGAVSNHIFIVDGYDINNLMHINFGWGGNNNGYYNLNFIPDFPAKHSMILQLYPKSSNYPNQPANSTICTSKEGLLTDGSGPNANYLPHINSSWILTPQKDQDSISNIEITINKADIKSGDILYIFDGLNTSAPLLAQLSSIQTPATYFTSGNSALINFKSNSFNQGEGWDIKYKSIYPDYCNTTSILNQTNGITLSDGSKNKNYLPNSNCQWDIIPDKGNPISFAFTQFDLSQGDTLFIVKSGTTEILDFFTSDKTPAMLSYDYGITIRFKTDHLHEAKGWEIQFDSFTALHILDSSSINIYPVPAHDLIQISGLNKKASHLIQLINSSGKIIQSKTVNNCITHTTFNTSNASSGIYWIKIISNQEIFNRTIIIN